MSSRRYFEEEMRYLREAGQAFAQAHPDQARFLNVDSVADRDPYVERLFEGVAFLTGRVHERLDDELPRYTEGLLSLLHPHFLKPVPSLTIVAFEPKPGDARKTHVVEAGAEVRSAPVGAEQTVCRFRTAQPVRVQPLALREVRLHRSTAGTSSARLRFALTEGADFDALTGLDRLRLYFHADAALASTMHRFFTRHVRAVTFREAASLRGTCAASPSERRRPEKALRLPRATSRCAGSRGCSPSASTARAASCPTARGRFRPSGCCTSTCASRAASGLPTCAAWSASGPRPTCGRSTWRCISTGPTPRTRRSARRTYGSAARRPSTSSKRTPSRSAWKASRPTTA